VSLEETTEEDWLELRNLLENFDSLVKDVENLRDHILWVGGVGWNEITLLQDKIKHEEWLWVLVLVEQCVEPASSLLPVISVLCSDILIWSFLKVTVFWSEDFLVECVGDLRS